MTITLTLSYRATQIPSALSQVFLLDTLHIDVILTIYSNETKYGKCSISRYAATQDLMVCELMDAHSCSRCREVVVRRQVVISQCLPHQMLLLDQTHTAWKLMVRTMQMLAVVLRAATSAAKSNRQIWLAKRMYTPAYAPLVHLCLCFPAYHPYHHADFGH